MKMPVKHDGFLRHNTETRLVIDRLVNTWPISLFAFTTHYAIYEIPWERIPSVSLIILIDVCSSTT